MRQSRIILSLHWITRVIVLYESCLRKMWKRLLFHGRPGFSIYITLGSVHKQVSPFRALLMKVLLSKQYLNCFPSNWKREQFCGLRFALQVGAWNLTKLRLTQGTPHFNDKSGDAWTLSCFKICPINFNMC